jgi:hypothetical protein
MSEPAAEPATAPPTGNDRPTFAERYPEHPTLHRALDAFSRGNFRSVRAIAAPLVTDPDAAVAAAAKDLIARISPDPIAYVLLGTTALLLVALTLWAIGQSHQHLTSPAKPRPAANASATP